MRVPCPGADCDRYLPAQLPHPLRHPQQPQTVRHAVFLLEPDAVVLNRHRQLATGFLQLNPDVLGLGVPRAVGEPFLHDAV